MLVYDGKLFLLGAEDNILRIYDTEDNSEISDIKLNAGGFATSIRQIPNTQYAIVCDIKRSEFSVIDLAKNALVNTYSLNVPVMDIVVANKYKGE